MTTDTPSCSYAKETGATVKDARLLARKAEKVFIHYKVGARSYDTDCVGMGHSAFLTLIEHKAEEQLMPCVFRCEDGRLWLSIGVLCRHD